jgi:dynein heavy chain, axonemal
MHESAEELKDRPCKDGSYIGGLFLEGANWDKVKSVLCEPQIMELEVEMPIIHFKPVQKGKAKVQSNMYSCPCYYYPIRKGVVGRESFMLNIDLKFNPDNSSQEHWIKRGTALLMSLKD